MFEAGVAELVGGSAGGDHVAELVVDEDELVEAHAAAVAGVVAAVAAAAVVELLAGYFLGTDVQLEKHFGGGLELGAAIFADLTHESLEPRCLAAWR